MCVTDAGAYVIGVDASVKRAERRGVSEFPVPQRRVGWIDRRRSTIAAEPSEPLISGSLQRQRPIVLRAADEQATGGGTAPELHRIQAVVEIGPAGRGGR